MKRLPRSISILLICLTLAGVAFAQKKDYKQGEKIECKESANAEWEECTFVGKSYDGSQPIIRDKSGFQMALSDWNQIRPMGAKPAAGNNQTKIDTDEGDRDNNDKRDTPKDKVEADGKGVMTKEEVLNYMRTHGYANGKPKHDSQVCKDLIELIKKRGVRERLDYGKDDVSPITENGCSYVGTDVIAAVDSNQGAPVAIDWLTGAWKMSIWGINNKYVNLNNGRVTSRDVVAEAGSLTINGNGTYVWRVEPDGKLFKATWRLATKEEMGYQGGVGVVLQNAAEGSDWIAFKKMPQDGDKTDRLEVEHIKDRGSNRYVGTRR
jgi:hypothetical protein